MVFMLSFLYDRAFLLRIIFGLHVQFCDHTYNYPPPTYQTPHRISLLLIPLLDKNRCSLCCRGKKSLILESRAISASIRSMRKELRGEMLLRWFCAACRGSTPAPWMVQGVDINVTPILCWVSYHVQVWYKWIKHSCNNCEPGPYTVTGIVLRPGETTTDYMCASCRKMLIDPVLSHSTAT